MRGEEPRVRIIVKKAKHGGGHHGGAWKVAYADFVTTLMALFIVLWIVGQAESVRVAIAKYFKDPGVFKHGGSASVLTGGSGVLDGERPAPEAEKTQAESAATREERTLQDAAERIKKLMAETPHYAVIKDQITVEVTPEGLRIEVAEREGSLFFRVGGATVLDELKPILENLARVLDTLPNAITLEGHTDSRQYANWRNYSNWELASDRANSARRMMEQSGLTPGRVERVVGHADRMLKFPDDSLNAGNRRITVIVRRAAG
jgi:chemotaxis protein MotB